MLEALSPSPPPPPRTHFHTKHTPQLGPLLANAKFVLEVREDKKSERSELIIILLIGVEIVLHVAGWYM